MSADVDQNVCAEYILQVTVGGHVLMSWRNIGIVQDLADLAIAACSSTAALGLHADHHIAILYAGDDDLALVEHGRRDAIFGLSRRISPGIADPVLHLGRGH